jgi:D-inositol-3-phosphate glycosyltransferase
MRTERPVAEGVDLTAHEESVALLTGGGDRPYAFGLSKALMSSGIALDIIGSDELDCPEFHGHAGVRFLNLRGDQRPDASVVAKALRLSMYYIRLVGYAMTARPRLFHILWNNKFEYFDRTLLMLYYRLLGKRIVLTVHNVNAGRRDSSDTFLNRLTLRIQYRLADHLFVHTDQMRSELIKQSGAQPERVTVIPFGINNSVPNTPLSPREARKRLGIGDTEKAVLFFGNIAPYKGLEYLVTAFKQITRQCDDYRLIIAGRPKGCEEYWRSIREAIREEAESQRVLLRSDFIPDEETELYFKAADVLVLPYTNIFQSGVLFLGYSFGLPVIASDVGSLRTDIIEGKTGYLCKPQDPSDLSRVLRTYFASDLYGHLDRRRQEIKNWANQRHSWDTVSQTTCAVYEQIVGQARKSRVTSKAIVTRSTP